VAGAGAGRFSISFSDRTCDILLNFILQVEPSGFISLLHSPSALVHGQKGGAFVLRVVCNHHTHEKGQTNHATEENVNVDVDSVYLINRRGSGLSLVRGFYD